MINIDWANIFNHSLINDACLAKTFVAIHVRIDTGISVNIDFAGISLYVCKCAHTLEDIEVGALLLCALDGKCMH